MVEIKDWKMQSGMELKLTLFWTVTDDEILMQYREYAHSKLLSNTIKANYEDKLQKQIKFVNGVGGWVLECSCSQTCLLIVAS